MLDRASGRVPTGVSMGMRNVRVVVLLMAMLAAAGCAGKKKGAAGGPGLSEEGVTPGGSLEQFRSGAALPKGEAGKLEDIHFAFDSYELDEEARRILRDNAEWLKDNGRVRVEIEGHCDERGTVEYNLALGAKRARAAKDYLTSLGVEADRMTTISYGEELPLCREHNEGCWQQNRRVHFVILRD